MHEIYERFGYALLSAYSKENNCVAKAVDFMVEHTKDANWDCVSRSMAILEAGFEKKPYTCALLDMTKAAFNRYFKQDMIYYTINYDGFRL